MIDLAQFAGAIESSPLGIWASETSLAYPLANVVHLLGLVMLVGGIGVVDLRLAGAFRAIPVAALSRSLTPIALGGLALMLPSGAIMFAADATSLVGSEVFGWKLLLILLALANALAFRALWRHRLAGWDADPPIAGRVMAVGSLMIWLSIATLGRMIAYS